MSRRKKNHRWVNPELHDHSSMFPLFRGSTHSAEKSIISDTIRVEAADEALVTICPGPSIFLNSMFWADDRG
jgi:hypothetical protein